MQTETIDLRAAADHEAIIARAAQAIRDGRPAVLPTETVYGAAVNAADSKALDRLWRMKGEARRAPLAWHLHTPAALLETCRNAAINPTPLHRRLLRLLTPGPVTLAIPATHEQLATLRRLLRVDLAVIDDNSEFLARIPDRAVTRTIIERADVPVVMASLGDSRLARTAGEAASIVGSRGDSEPVLILDDGPTSYTQQSTLIRLIPSGGYHVVRAGALDERTIRKRMTRTILFVCTGNTCRSPMAAAIARHLLAGGGEGGIETRIRSAGTSAGFGMEATPEGVESLRSMGIEMERHASTPLSRELVNEAEVIYGMTRAHVESILRFDPSARGRVHLLDPAGRDIPDPIGSPQEAYDSTARMLHEALAQRLRELPE